MKKYFLLLSIFLVFNSTLLCSAKKTKNIEQIFQSEETNDLNEKEIIKYIIDNSMSDMNEMLGGTTSKLASSKVNTVGEYSMDDAYKIYHVTEPDIIDEYKEKGNFSSIISENYSWKIPTDLGYLITVNKNGNDWKFSALSNELKNSNLNKKSINITQQDTISDIVNNYEKINEISDLKYVISNMYHTTFAYIKADDIEYLIPYGTRPELTGLNNGNVYTAEEVINTLSLNFNVYEKDNTDANGGFYTSVIETNNILIPIVMTIIIFIISALILIKKKARNRNI